jgi:hypothetical protein
MAALTEVNKMKIKLIPLLLIIIGLTLTACSRGEGGAAGYGAGGGKSLREGSTSPLHSPIAQDQTYQKILGLNILLYPPPVDDPKFDEFGAAFWELDPADFVEAMRAEFSGQMGDQAVYEPVVEALQDHPLVAEIQEMIYNGEPVQVGWVYGNNANLDYLELNEAPVTLITAENAVLFVGSKANLDQTAWTFDVKNANAFYIPANSVVSLKPETLHSAPVRVSEETGVLTAVIVPEGLGAETVSPGSGMDQALVSNNRWIFAFPGVMNGLFEGLTGSNKSIVAID